MPIYEYSCSECGRIMEAWQKFSDSPLCECEACGGKLKKIISHNSFHLKGSGWYVTDYAGKSGGVAKPADKTDKPDTSSASKDTAKKSVE
jgi:putative FmdB family regulatory protein